MSMTQVRFIAYLRIGAVDDDFNHPSWTAKHERYISFLSEIRWRRVRVLDTKIRQNV